MGVLEGQVAIITGAASGQGARAAEVFAEEGARVVLTDINEAGGGEALEIGADRALFQQHDVGSAADWNRVIAATLARFGRIDILVNNAAVYHQVALVETTDEIFDRTIRTNQRGCFLGMRAVVEPMEAVGGGSIVNNSAGAGLKGVPHMIAYLSTKWAMRGMTKAAALELGPLGIRVNSIHPGLVETPMSMKGTSREALRGFFESTPLGRMGSTDDTAALMLFLASSQSSWITGAEIAIDGGWAAS